MHIAIIGASGAIGDALTQNISASHPEAMIDIFSRSKMQTRTSNINAHFIDLADEKTIEDAAILTRQNGELDLVIVAAGLLHEDGLSPEKSLRDLSAEKFGQLFAINTIGPALVAKHFLPLLHKQKRAVFAALSARVSSISDNRLGGWYAYRASKAALNMVLKNASIELARSHKQAIIVGLHPGTVDSNLSKPFQSRVQAHSLFTPEQAATHLISVIEKLTVKDSGKLFAWDGQEIEF